LQLRSHPEAPPRLYRSNLTDSAVNKWASASPTPEADIRMVQTLITNTANVWGIATLPGYDAAIPTMVDRVWDAGLVVGQSALRLLGADYAMLPVADPAAAKNDRPGLEPLMDPLPGARLYHVTGALPRVYLARHAEVLSDDQTVKRMYEPEVVAGESVWLASDSDLPALSAPPGRAGTCSLDSYSNNRLVSTCTARERGLAVFVEQYDRGWHAQVDGQSVRLLRANLIMRALPLEPGTHRIVLEYQTPGLRAGAAISLLCLLMLGLLGLPAPRWQAPARSGQGRPASCAGRRRTA
jgi:hypothetical protein